MTDGYVLFRLGAQTFAAPLDAVHEIVRLRDLQPLPAAAPPLAGMVVVRGRPLPVMDVRDESSREAGDVLVTGGADEVLGVAVDSVLAVLSAADLTTAEPPASGLPDYVRGISRRADEPVLLVDLTQLVESRRVQT